MSERLSDERLERIENLIYPTVDSVLNPPSRDELKSMATELREARAELKAIETAVGFFGNPEELESVVASALSVRDRFRAELERRRAADWPVSAVSGAICVQPDAPKEKCAMCGCDVPTCERQTADGETSDYRCPAHPFGNQRSDGRWTCSERCDQDLEAQKYIDETVRLRAELERVKAELADVTSGGLSAAEHCCGEIKAALSRELAEARKDTARWDKLSKLGVDKIWLVDHREFACRGTDLRFVVDGIDAAMEGK